MNNTLLIGGNSKLGIAIRNKDKFRGTYVSRNIDNFGNAIFKHSYNHLTADDFSGYEQVINLVGSHVADTETLKAVNVYLAHHLAKEARKAGVKNFINISSFSVFGSASEIDFNSLPSPESNYGKSKLQAELVLGQISDANFSVTNVRLPMLYGGQDSKLHLLLAFWAKTRYFPVPNLVTKRSMLHYDLAADALLDLISASGLRIVAFADPEPFQFARVAKVMSDCAGHRVSPLVVGRHLLDPLKWAMPATYHSLYSSSYLLPSANDIESTALESRLYMDIYEIATSLYA